MAERDDSFYTRSCFCNLRRSQTKLNLKLIIHTPTLLSFGGDHFVLRSIMISEYFLVWKKVHICMPVPVFLRMYLYPCRSANSKIFCRISISFVAFFAYKYRVFYFSTKQSFKLASFDISACMAQYLSILISLKLEVKL